MRLSVVLSTIATVSLLAISAPASAQLGEYDAITSEKPLLIVRYNQARIYFDKALSRAVKAAERAKPDMVYNVVAYVPESQSARMARAHLRSVVESLQAQGVPADRINWQTEPTSGGYQEIHLYVE